MLPEPNSAGFLLYLLEIFLPGIGFGELLQLWKKEDSLVERVGLAFGLGLSIDTIVLLIRTSKLGGLEGIDIYTLYGIILAGLVALLISFAKKRNLRFPKPTRIDYVLIVFIIAQSLMLLLYFTKYPIFPEYQSQDYAIHVQLAQSLISGSTTSIPSGILYYGIHYQLASGLLFVGGEPLVTARQTMAILIVLSSLLFYSSTKKIFQDSRVALITTDDLRFLRHHLVCERIRLWTICKFLRHTCSNVPVNCSNWSCRQLEISFSLDHLPDFGCQRVHVSLHTSYYLACNLAVASSAVP